MKNLSSQTEGLWFERKNPTESQFQILRNGTQEEKKAVINALNVNPSNADIAKANELYSLKKPRDENYNFISCSITLCENPRGIINYKINNEHKQIRF
jgi:hypothetical protein